MQKEREIDFNQFDEQLEANRKINQIWLNSAFNGQVVSCKWPYKTYLTSDTF